MESLQKRYYFSMWAMILCIFIILIYSADIIGLLAILYYRSILLGVFLTIPFLVFLLDPLTRFSRVLYFSITNKPALLFLDDRLIDNVNDIIINWEEIDHVGWLNKSKLGGQITIAPKDLTMILKRIKNPYRKIILRLNQRYFNGAISIPPNLIKCKRDELYHDLVKTHFKKQVNAVLYLHK